MARRGGAESTTVRMKTYKYVRLGDEQGTESEGSRESWQDKRAEEWRGGGGKVLTEVDCPVCSVMCYVTLLPVFFLFYLLVCVYLCLFNSSTHSTATVKHMLTCLVCSSAI